MLPVTLLALGACIGKGFVLYLVGRVDQAGMTVSMLKRMERLMGFVACMSHV
jgi:hypothetical protein